MGRFKPGRLAFYAIVVVAAVGLFWAIATTPQRADANDKKQQEQVTVLAGDLAASGYDTSGFYGDADYIVSVTLNFKGCTVKFSREFDAAAAGSFRRGGRSIRPYVVEVKSADLRRGTVYPSSPSAGVLDDFLGSYAGQFPCYSG